MSQQLVKLFEEKFSLEKEKDALTKQFFRGFFFLNSPIIVVSGFNFVNMGERISDFTLLIHRIFFFVLITWFIITAFVFTNLYYVKIPRFSRKIKKIDKEIFKELRKSTE